MARPVRIDVKNAWYHIAARGIERRRIFHGPRYCEHFLELLEAMGNRYGVEVHAYVLMGNHYHLLIRTPNANASQALQWLNVSYSAWFNRKRQRVGHVFQGRFKSVIIENNGGWLLSVSAYLHLNPVRVTELGLGKRGNKAESQGLVPPDKESIHRGLDVLKHAPWSSYQAYAGYKQPQKWLVTRNILSRGGGKVGYRRYVESHVTRGEDPDIFETMEDRVALGTQAFLEKVKDLAGQLTKEQPERRFLVKRADFEAIVGLVEKTKGEKWEDFNGRYGDWGRNLVLYLARQRSGLTLRQIGEQVGPSRSGAAATDYKTVSKAIHYFEQRLVKDASLRKLTASLLSQLSIIET